MYDDDAHVDTCSASVLTPISQYYDIVSMNSHFCCWAASTSYVSHLLHAYLLTCSAVHVVAS